MDTARECVSAVAIIWPSENAPTYRDVNVWSGPPAVHNLRDSKFFIRRIDVKESGRVIGVA